MSRFAACHDLELRQFMAALVPDKKTTEAGGTTRLLDYGPRPPGTDAALAAAADLPLEVVAGLRRLDGRSTRGPAVACRTCAVGAPGTW